jgi:hypothetical protein
MQRTDHIITLQGGLGNQLFQYAYGRKLMLVDKKKILFNVSSYYDAHNPNITPRTFLLPRFNILQEYFTVTQRPHILVRYTKKLIAKIFRTDSFYQNEKYFKQISDVLRKEFTLRSPLSPQSTVWLQKISSASVSIAVHIRRGDYVLDQHTHTYHGVCDTDYYKNASALIEQKLSHSDMQYFIFSDDIEWAQHNIRFNYPTHFVSHTDIPDYEELFIMSLCNHNIIANSTFSWWAAWLNTHPDKIIVGPKRWFAHSNKTHICPPEWLTV